MPFRWAIDPFRYQPPYTAAAKMTTAAACSTGCSTPQPALKKQKLATGQPTPATHAPAGSTAAAAAHRLDTLLSLSPFRRELQGLAWQYVRLPGNTLLARAIGRLIAQLPKPLPADWKQQLALGQLRFRDVCKPLFGADGARIRPGVISFTQLVGTCNKHHPSMWTQTRSLLSMQQH